METLPAREQAFKDLAESTRKFHEALDTWEDSLPRDDQAEIIYPQQGAPGGAYQEELSALMLTDFQTDLHGVMMDLVKFKHKQDTATQLRIARSTTLDFLQANDVEAVLAGQIEQEQAENDISQQEEEGQGDGRI